MPSDFTKRDDLSLDAKPGETMGSWLKRWDTAGEQVWIYGGTVVELWVVVGRSSVIVFRWSESSILVLKQSNPM